MKKSHRETPLEASRGVAAIIVLIHHFFLGFAPLKSGVMPEIRDDFSFIGHWYFILCNGTGAVYFFFVLSGFVLCWGFFKTGDVQKLKIDFLKRFARLLAPVLVTVLVSYLLFHFGLYFFYDASKVSGSPWLATFASAGWTPEFKPSFYKAIVQGVTTFISGDASYNSNLWTMKPEFIGSIFIFLLGAFISFILSFEYLLVSFMLVSFWALSLYGNLFPFVVGIFVSAFLVKHELSISLPKALAIIAIGLYLLGYALPEKNYLWVSYITYPDILVNNIQVILNSLGAALVIFSIMCNLQIYTFLNGRFCNYLGQLSFPLYLVHTLIICSLSSFTFLYLNNQDYPNKVILLCVFVLTLAGSIMAATPLIFFDKFWLRLTNKLVRFWA
jgi:peptidoglycan/LPS O-acetylase OafA/YrhL